MSKNWCGNGISAKIIDFEAQLYQEMCDAEIKKEKYGKYNLKRAQIRWGAIMDLMKVLKIKSLGDEIGE